jgi:hypothetical protein
MPTPARLQFYAASFLLCLLDNLSHVLSLFRANNKCLPINCGPRPLAPNAPNAINNYAPPPSARVSSIRCFFALTLTAGMPLANRGMDHIHFRARSTNESPPPPPPPSCSFFSVQRKKGPSGRVREGRQADISLNQPTASRCLRSYEAHTSRG